MVTAIPPLLAGQHQIFTLSGTSAAGKSTLMAAAKDTLGDNLLFAESFTTRDPRPGEKTGVPRNFVSMGVFNQLRRMKPPLIIEEATYDGNKYGMGRHSFVKAIREGKRIIADIGVPGVAAIRKFFPKQTLAIYVLPPDNLEHPKPLSQLGVADIPGQKAVLKERLEKRPGATPENIKQRLGLAEKELTEYYTGTMHYDAAIVTGNLQQARQQMVDIMLTGIVPAEARPHYPARFGAQAGNRFSAVA